MGHALDAWCGGGYRIGVKRALGSGGRHWAWGVSDSKDGEGDRNERQGSLSCCVCAGHLDARECAVGVQLQGCPKWSTWFGEKDPQHRPAHAFPDVLYSLL